ncbi:hypothetical protein GCM10022409_45300 [Hymenobacter glaciei]|uniref:Uncharacterized protein n=1 Tax=Hymenobacter glaciei TaxID=877209 RepID=A0ABP7UUW1_9BACT
MADSIDDFYHQKTDSELQFFVDHPELYQPSLIDSARRELRRRGVALAAPAELPALTYVSPDQSPAGGLRTGPLALGLAAVLVVGLGSFYVVKQKKQPPPVPTAPAKPKAPPRLEEVEMSAIPTYDGVVDQAVAQQVQRLPAAERAAAKAKANGMALRQYRELAKRFWAAECQTEYLTNQAHAGKAGAMFADQALVARATWSNWNKAAVYTYKFGPAMQEDFQRMQEVASSQQHVLERMPDLLPQRQFLTDKELNARGAEVQDWLRVLCPASPVTGKAYKATVIKMQM